MKMEYYIERKVTDSVQYNEIGIQIGENLIKNYGFSSPMIQFVG